MSENTRTLGQAVTFVNERGLQRAAIVIGTAESIQPGHSLVVPTMGQLHLAVFRPSTGLPMARHSVPHLSQVPLIQAMNGAVAMAEAEEDGEEQPEIEDAPVAHWF